MMQSVRYRYYISLEATRSTNFFAPQFEGFRVKVDVPFSNQVLLYQNLWHTGDVELTLLRVHELIERTLWMVMSKF